MGGGDECLSPGGDASKVIPGNLAMTVAQCKAKCDAEAECEGFSVKLTDKESKETPCFALYRPDWASGGATMWEEAEGFACFRKPDGGAGVAPPPGTTTGAGGDDKLPLVVAATARGRRPNGAPCGGGAAPRPRGVAWR